MLHIAVLVLSFSFQFVNLSFMNKNVVSFTHPPRPVTRGEQFLMLV